MNFEQMMRERDNYIVDNNIKSSNCSRKHIFTYSFTGVDSVVCGFGFIKEIQKNRHRSCSSYACNGSCNYLQLLFRYQ